MEVRSTQFPTDPREAYELDESNVGTWADGPIRLIILKEEKEIWDGLEKDEQPRMYVNYTHLIAQDTNELIVITYQMIK